MIKIMLASPLPPPYGGIGNWTNLLHKHCSKFGVEIFQIDTSPKKRSVDSRSFLQRVLNGFLSLLRCKKCEKQIIKNEKNISCLHIATSGNLALFRDYQLLKVAKKKKIKRVLQIRYGRIPSVIKKNGWEARILIKTLNLCDLICVLDTNTFNCLKSIGFNNVLLIPNPIELEDVLSITTNIKKMANRVIFCGWMNKNKGIEDLLKAWGKVQIDVPDSKLILVGPSEKKYFSSICCQSSGIEYLGELNHEQCLCEIKKASILVLPSKSEGFPNVILEAMACRTTIIATDVGALPYILSNECGICIKQEDIDQLSNSLISLLTNKKLRDSLSKNAYNKCANDFSLEAVFKRYIEIWR